MYVSSNLGIQTVIDDLETNFDRCFCGGTDISGDAHWRTCVISFFSNGKVAKPKNHPCRLRQHKAFAGYYPWLRRVIQEKSSTTCGLASVFSAVVPSWSGRDPGFTRLVKSSSWYRPVFRFWCSLPWNMPVPVRLQQQDNTFIFCVSEALIHWKLWADTFSLNRRILQ